MAAARNYVDISPIKAEKIKKEAKHLKKEQLRAYLPVYNADQIRKLRLPYHEALLAQLEDIECPSSVQFIKELFAIQEKMMAKLEPMSPSLLWPKLYASKAQLDIVFASLVKTERAHNAGEYTIEWEEFLKLGAQYAFGPEEWWWLGREFLYQCLSMDYPGDFAIYRAKSKYLTGKFCLENLKDDKLAEAFLNETRDMSMGHPWTAKKLLEDQRDCIYMESCSLLFMVLYRQAERAMHSHPEEAYELCSLARKRASEACRHDQEVAAYLLMGQCKTLLKDFEGAVVTFSRALRLAKRKGMITERCEAMIQVALAYLQLRRANDALMHLRDLEKFAEENELPYYVAQSQRFLGEYYLNQEDFAKAATLLMKAFEMFHEANDLPNREEVRNFAAIANGKQFYELYVRIVQKSTHPKRGPLNLSKLLDWKDSRKPFWNEESALSILSYIRKSDHSVASQKSNRSEISQISKRTEASASCTEGKDEEAGDEVEEDGDSNHNSLKVQEFSVHTIASEDPELQS